MTKIETAWTKSALLVLFSWALSACSSAPPARDPAAGDDGCGRMFSLLSSDELPPATRRDPVVTDDPYRWLEANTPERRQWRADQHKYTQRYLAKNKWRPSWETFFRDLWDQKATIAQEEAGDLTLKLLDRGLARATELVSVDKAGAERILLSTYQYARNGSAEFIGMSASPTGSHVVTVMTERGSLDDFKLIIMDPRTRRIVETVEKSDGTVVWISPTEFLYGKNYGVVQQVFKHRLGTDPGEDTLFSELKDGYVNYSGTDDKKWAFYPNRKYSDQMVLRRVADQKDFAVKEPVAGVLGSVGNQVVVQLTGSKELGEIGIATLGDGKLEKITTIVPEKGDLIVSAELSDGRVEVSYQTGIKRKYVAYDLAGKEIYSYEPPEFAVIQGVEYDAAKKQLALTFASPAQKSVKMTYDLATGKYLEGDPREKLLKVGNQELVVEYIEVTSKDGAKVPVRVTYLKGTDRNGNNPALIEGYGGFTSPGYFLPSFSPATLQFIQLGGVHVAPALRGSVELGPEWHRAGMLTKKQNVFNDMIATAETVQALGYTNPKRTAAMGWSNGGLLIGAMLAQRPDLFRVLIPGNGVQDMIRREILDIRFNYGWSYEYGYLNDPEIFKVDLALSPVANLRPGFYPTVLTPSGSNDSRVASAHSYKLVAAAQAAQLGSNPIMLMPTNNSGHWVTKESYQDLIAWRRSADLWATMCLELGMQIPVSAISGTP